MNALEFVNEVDVERGEGWQKDVGLLIHKLEEYASIKVKEAAQQSVQPTVATEPLEDSPWQTGARRGAVIPSNRNSG